MSRYYIGGSQVAAILDVDPWTTPLKLYTRKLGLLGYSGDTSASKAGRYLEPGIIDWYRDEAGTRVIPWVDVVDILQGETPPGLRPGAWEVIKALEPYAELWHTPRGFAVLRSKEHPHMVAQIDGFEIGPDNELSTVDVKNLAWHREEVWQHGDPVAYRLQLDHGLAVCGPAFTKGAAVAVFGGQTIAWKTWDRDEENVRFVVEQTRAFVRRLEEQRPPPAEASRRELEALRALYPLPDVETSIHWPALVEFDGVPLTASQFHAQVTEAVDQRANWSVRWDALKARILDKIGDARMAELPDGTVYRRADNGAITIRTPKTKGRRRD